MRAKKHFVSNLVVHIEANKTRPIYLIEFSITEGRKELSSGNEDVLWHLQFFVLKDINNARELPITHLLKKKNIVDKTYKSFFEKEQV